MDAKNPEDYARDVRHINGYVLTTLPPNMPLHEGIVKVPNFVGSEYKIRWFRIIPPPLGVDIACDSEWGSGKKLMDTFEDRLQFEIVQKNVSEPISHIVAQSLEAGTLVKKGSTIVLTTTFCTTGAAECAGLG